MDNKEILKNRITRQLGRWKKSIGDVTARLAAAEENAEIQLRQQLDRLHDKRAQAEKILDEVSRISQEAWEDVKAGVERGWADLTRTAKTAARKARETMAPADRDEEIRQIAYFLWLDEGCPHGRHLDHWYQAEAIWRQRQEPATLKSKPPAKAKSAGGAASRRRKTPARKSKRAGGPKKNQTDTP